MQPDNLVTMKVVGRRGRTPVNAASIDALQRMANALRQGRPFIPKGVHRFASFEEANAWTLRMMTRPWNHASQP